MGKNKNKKKTPKKPKVEEAPPADETEDEAKPETEVASDEAATADPHVGEAGGEEPETADPFAEGAENEGETDSKDGDESEGSEDKTEDGDEDEAAEEEKPVAPPDRPTVTFAEKHAQKRGEEPVDGDAKRGSITDWLGKVQYTADDIESVAYYALAGISVLTMSDGKKFDVTD